MGPEQARTKKPQMQFGGKMNPLIISFRDHSSLVLLHSFLVTLFQKICSRNPRGVKMANEN